MLGGVAGFISKRGQPTFGPSHQSLVLIGHAVSEEIFNDFFNPIFFYTDGRHLGYQAGSSNDILRGPTQGPSKFGSHWPSSFKGKDFEIFLL